MALGSFPEPSTATIVYIGVVPEQRGNGYVNDLLAAAAHAARARGVRHILSDADVENAPMLDALRRAGHDESARPWHVWQFRRSG